MNLSKIDKIVFFGDSLSDTGNLYRSLRFIPKSPPYYQGRFSNGVVWTETLATKLNKPFYVYAVGGATATLQNPLAGALLYNLGAEVSLYFTERDMDNRRNSLAFIWIGANDYFNDSQSDVNALTDKVVNAIYTQIDTLAEKGFTNIVVLNLPDLSKTPYGQGLDDLSKSRLSQLVNLHNIKISAMSHNYNIISLIDIASIFNNIIVNPIFYNTKYNINITNITNSCWDGNFFAYETNKTNKMSFSVLGFILKHILPIPMLLVANIVGNLSDSGQVPASDQSNHFFWDKIHPTTVVHNLLANIIYDELIS